MNDFFNPKKSKLVGLNENTVNESVFDVWNSKPNNNKEEPVYKCCDSQIAEIYKQIIDNNEKAIVVAGTGVGKTFNLFNLELEDKTAMIYIAHFRALSDKFANEYQSYRIFINGQAKPLQIKEMKSKRQVRKSSLQHLNH